MDEFQLEFSENYIKFYGYDVTISEIGVATFDEGVVVQLSGDQLQELASIVKSFRDRRTAYRGKNG